MKSLFIIGVIAAGAYLGWQYLPQNYRDEIHNDFTRSLAYLLHFRNFLPPLAPIKEKVISTANGLVPENPVQKREDLIKKLSQNVQTAAYYAREKTPAAQKSLEAKLEESKNIITELEAENPKNGAISDVVGRIADIILPSPNPSACVNR